MDTTETRYPFECACGERYRTIEAARACRKCRQYLVNPEDQDEVIDVRTNSIVWSAPVNWDEELRGAESKWPTLAAVWPRRRG